MRSIIVSPRAGVEIDSAIRWYDEKSPGLGDAFLSQLHKTMRLMSDYPQAFAPISEKLRRAVIGQFPYSIIYSVSPEHIDVVGVVADKRHPRHFKR